MDPFVRLVQALHERDVRFVAIGVWGANYYAHAGATIFTTKDRDVFLPLEAASVLGAWEACAVAGLSLWVGDEPLDLPRDLVLAERVVERRAAIRATDAEQLEVDLTLVMEGFDFEEVWGRRRTFTVDGVDVPVARLKDIVASKAKLGRPKDQLFLATHQEALDQLMGRDEEV